MFAYMEGDIQMVETENNDEVLACDEPKTIAYDYMFNYFGGDCVNGKVICGACVQLAIRAFKDGKEMKFVKEPSCHGKHFNEIYNISFDRDKLFVVEKNLRMDNLFRLVFGWDKIEAEVVGYTLDYYEGMLSEVMTDGIEELPEFLRNMPCTAPMEVPELVFREFLSNRIEDFDISDNINAQVPSISFI